MAKRISFTPGDQLRLIPGSWQAKFASESAETLIREGRRGEVLQTISGLSLADLKGESLSLRENCKSKKKRIQRGKQLDTSSIEAVPTSTGQVPQELIDAVAEENTMIQESTRENRSQALVADEKMCRNAEEQPNLF